MLAGSRKYPVRDAFNELGKASLRTFLNAFTAPDFTCYPVASQVRADFYNLAAVYTDLVLRPLLRENTFLQEGHHLEVGEDGTLTVSGIVYNEMKGAYSSPERVAESTTQQALFPDTPYGVESGGHPDHIPDLTYEAFREFHRRFYSPSNCRVFFYGNIATADHLAFLAGQLEGFARIEVDSAVPEQPRWTAPREVQDHYPAGPGRAVGAQDHGEHRLADRADGRLGGAAGPGGAGRGAGRQRRRAAAPGADRLGAGRGPLAQHRPAGLVPAAAVRRRAARHRPGARGRDRGARPLHALDESPATGCPAT